MRIRYVIFAVALGAVMSACHNKKTADVDASQFETIDSTGILDNDLLKGFKPTDAAVKYAHGLYLKGVELLDKEHKAKESKPLLLMSIRYAPEPIKYLRYADACYAQGEYKLAESLYEYCEYNGDLKGQGHLGAARCEFMNHDTIRAMMDFGNALGAFPFEEKKILEDPVFSKVKDLEGFRITMAQYKKDPAQQRNAMLKLMIEKFPKASLPFSIGIDDVFLHGKEGLDMPYGELLPDVYLQMEYNKNSRDVTPMARLDLSPAFHALVYRSVSLFPDTLQPVSEVLVIYGPGDSIMSRQEIACGCSPQTVKSCTVNADGSIEVKEYYRTWKDDPEYHGYKGNVMLSQELKKTMYYQVRADGHIVAVEKGDAK